LLIPTVCGAARNAGAVAEIVASRKEENYRYADKTIAMLSSLLRWKP